MDELKIKSDLMRGLVGKAVVKYLKKKGIDIGLVINDIDGVTSEHGTTKLHADITLTVNQAQLIKLLS